MKEITIKVANKVDDYTVHIALEKVIRKLGFHYEVGQGGTLSEWKNKDLEGDGVLLIFRIKKKPEDKRY